jgi:hypothetical protein
MCETRSLILRGEYRLRVFENMVLRKRFAPKKDEVRRGGENCVRRSCVSVLFAKCNYNYKVEEDMRWSGHGARMGEKWTMCRLKNGVFWVVTPCGSCKNRRFGGTWRLLHQGDKNR